jgi:hypothetical protein
LRSAKLDNPGWSIRIDLVGTPLEGRRLDYAVLDEAEPAWVHFWSDGERFEAATGPTGLVSALGRFRISADSGA